VLPGAQGASPVFQEFIREGCLHKLTKKGLQQRMFFLVGSPPHLELNPT
jgi:FERM/RhoGEF/pleckstrin domain protein 2